MGVTMKTIPLKEKGYCRAYILMEDCRHMQENQKPVLIHLSMILRKKDTLIFMVRMETITFITIDKERGNCDVISR